MKRFIKLYLLLIFLLPTLAKAQSGSIAAGGSPGGNDPQEVYMNMASGMENNINYFYNTSGSDFWFLFPSDGTGAFITGTFAPVFDGTLTFWNGNRASSGHALHITDTKGIIVNGTLDFGTGDDAATVITTDRTIGNAGGVHFGDAGTVLNYTSGNYIDGYASKSTSTASFTFPVGAGSEYMPVTASGFSNPVSLAYYNSSAQGFTSLPNPDQEVAAYADGTPIISPAFKVWTGGYWDWNASSTPVSSVTVPAPASLGAADNSTLMGYDGTKWVILGTPGSPLTGAVPANILKLGIGTSTTPLPVKLIDFSGRRLSDGNHLYWSTSEELNTDHFELEYSADGHSFTKVATVKAAGTTNTRQDYQELHVVSGVAYYRLRIVDVDGKYSYSKVIRINDNSNGNGDCLTLGMVYPVPFTSTLNIKLSSCKDQPATIMLVAVNGAKVVAAQKVQLQKGEFVYTLQNLSGLAQGMYVVRVQTADAIVTEKTLKQ